MVNTNINPGNIPEKIRQVNSAPPVAGIPLQVNAERASSIGPVINGTISTDAMKTNTAITIAIGILPGAVCPLLLIKEHLP